MAELALALAFAFGGAIGFLVGRSTAPKRTRGTAPGGKRPGQGDLP